MNKAFEKILEMLEEELIPLNQEITRYFYELKDTDNPKYIYAVGRSNALTDFKYNIKQLAEEYNNGWIPCSERLPKEYGDYLVWWTDITRGQYYEIVEYEPSNGWIGDIPQAVEGKYSVIAWQPLPQPPKGE